MGEKFGALQLAVRALDVGGSVVVRTSPVVATRAFGGVARSPFANAIVVVQTSMSPLQLLDRCREIEWFLGRRPARRWADRTIDIDILLYGEQCIAAARLCVPHPRMVEREFQLALLALAWPEARNPWTGLRYVDTLPTPLTLPIVATLPTPTRRDVPARVRCAPSTEKS